MSSYTKYIDSGESVTVNNTYPLPQKEFDFTEETDFIPLCVHFGGEIYLRMNYLTSSQTVCSVV